MIGTQHSTVSATRPSHSARLGHRRSVSARGCDSLGKGLQAAPRRREGAYPHQATYPRSTDRSAGASLTALGRGPTLERGAGAPLRRPEGAYPHQATYPRSTDRSAGASLTALGRGPNPTLGARPSGPALVRSTSTRHGRPGGLVALSRTRPALAPHRDLGNPRFHHPQRRQVGARAPASRRHSATDRELSNKKVPHPHQAPSHPREQPDWQTARDRAPSRARGGTGALLRARSYRARSPLIRWR